MINIHPSEGTLSKIYETFFLAMDCHFFANSGVFNNIYSAKMSSN